MLTGGRRGSSIVAAVEGAVSESVHRSILWAEQRITRMERSHHHMVDALVREKDELKLQLRRLRRRKSRDSRETKESREAQKQPHVQAAVQVAAAAVGAGMDELSDASEGRAKRGNGSSTYYSLSAAVSSGARGVPAPIWPGARSSPCAIRVPPISLSAATTPYSGSPYSASSSPANCASPLSASVWPPLSPHSPESIAATAAAVALVKAEARVAASDAAKAHLAAEVEASRSVDENRALREALREAQENVGRLERALSETKGESKRGVGC